MKFLVLLFYNLSKIFTYKISIIIVNYNVEYFLDQCLDSVVKAIKNDVFLISPHSEVVGYFQNKANNYARWIGGMQKLRSRLKS